MIFRKIALTALLDNGMGKANHFNFARGTEQKGDYGSDGILGEAS